MSTEQSQDGIIVIGLDSPVRALWPTLFTPRKVKNRRGQETGDPVYSLSLLIDPEHPDLKALKSKIKEVARDKWPDVSLKDLKIPLQDGNKAAEKSEGKGKDGSFFEDQVVLKTKSKYAPSVVDGRTSPPKPTEDQKLIYSGCYVALEINVVAYDAVDDDSKDGVTCYLNSVCFVSPGDRIAGKDHAATFRSIRGKASDESVVGDDNNDDDDDEIPF